MIRLAANLSYLFRELPFLERFAAAADAGFRAVELAFPYDVPAPELAARLQGNGLVLALINTPLGDATTGEVGLAVLPGRERDTAAAFAKALDYAVALDAKLIHFLAGKPSKGSDKRELDELFLKNLCSAADLAAKVGRVLTLEPLNQRDQPGYHLSCNSHARALIAASGRGNVKLQFDLYHCQVSEGDLTRSVERNIDLIAHVQIAGVPERSEPNLGEIAYPNVLGRLDSLGYKGYVGCEYSPSGDTRSGLAWAMPYLEVEAAS